MAYTLITPTEQNFCGDLVRNLVGTFLCQVTSDSKSSFPFPSTRISAPAFYPLNGKWNHFKLYQHIFLYILGGGKSRCTWGPDGACNEGDNNFAIIWHVTSLEDPIPVTQCQQHYVGPEWRVVVFQNAWFRKSRFRGGKGKDSGSRKDRTKERPGLGSASTVSHPQMGQPETLNRCKAAHNLICLSLEQCGSSMITI